MRENSKKEANFETIPPITNCGLLFVSPLLFFSFLFLSSLDKRTGERQVRKYTPGTTGPLACLLPKKSPK